MLLISAAATTMRATLFTCLMSRKKSTNFDYKSMQGQFIIHSGSVRMAQYSFNEYTDMLLHYGEAHCNGRAAQRLYVERFPNRPAPGNGIFARVAQRLRETGSLIVNRADCGAPKSRRTLQMEEMLDAIEEEQLTSTSDKIQKMAQGKLKVKTKLPSSVKGKGNKAKKGPANQRRGNAPVQPKKVKLQEVHKLKKIITKTVNNAMEDELRERALEGKKSLTKKDSLNLQKK